MKWVVLRKQPEEADPERSAEHEGQEDAAGGTEPGLDRFSLTRRPDDVVQRRHDTVVLGVARVRSVEVREWPIYENLNGHTVL